MEKIRDLTREMKKARKTTRSVREIRAECQHQYWEETRNGKFRCGDCGTNFPCRSVCTHLDCAEFNGELEIVAALMGVTVIDGESGKILYDYGEKT